MTTITETRHAGEFIMSEANGHRSRETGTLKTGQDVVAGTVMQLDGTGDMIAWDDTSEEACGIILATMDVDADTPAAYLARDAEVNANLLEYGEAALADVEATLALLGIIVRS